MSQMKWFDRSLPETLRNAVLIAYFEAALSILFMVIYALRTPLLLAFVVVGVGAIGIANEKRWGYWLAVVATVLAILVQVGSIPFIAYAPTLIFPLLIAVVLLILLLHPMSRSYQKIWFH